MSDLTALWREDATKEETVEAYQASVTDRYLRRAGASRAVEFARLREWTAA